MTGEEPWRPCRAGDCGQGPGEAAAYGCRFPGDEARGIPPGPAGQRDRPPERGPVPVSRWERESVTLNGQRPPGGRA